MKKFVIKNPFELYGKVEGVLIGSTHGTHVTTPMEQIEVLIREGICGDKHAGYRLADVREEEILKFGLPKRIEIANHRQFSAVSVEELNEIAESMEIPKIPYGLLGENLIISGIPNFTFLPPKTMLFFKKDGVISRAVLVVWGENAPCIGPGEAIQKLTDKHIAEVDVVLQNKEKDLMVI